MLACMDRRDVDRTALAAVCGPFRLRGPVMGGAQRLLRFGLLHLNPLGRALYATMVNGRNDFVLAGKKICIYPEPDNAVVFDAVERHPGMVGAKAHPFMHRYPVSLLDPVAAWCAERGRPLLIHLGGHAGRGDFRRLPERYPGLKVVYAHAGIPYFRKLRKYAKGKDGVYVDLSSPYLDPALVRETVDFLGADRCIYGTDGPYGPQPPGEDYDYGLIKGWIEALGLPASDREKVFSGNFLALTGRLP